MQDRMQKKDERSRRDKEMDSYKGKTMRQLLEWENE